MKSIPHCSALQVENIFLKKKPFKERLKVSFKKYPLADGGVSTAFRLYRYISLLLTSLLYLVGASIASASLFLKIGPVVLLTALTVLVLEGYKRYYKNIPFVSMLILLETMFIVLLLIISGGLKSAFVWYALNPLIAAAAYLPLYFTWIFLGLFFSWALAGEMLLYKNAASIWQVIIGYSDIILIMILLTLVIQIFSRLYLILREQAHRLQQQQKQMEKTLEHIASLYEAVETISSRDDLREIIDLFAAYARALTGCEKVIFWMATSPGEKGAAEQQNFIYTVRGEKDSFPEDLWQPALLQAWTEIKEHPRMVVKEMEDCSQGNTGQLICIPVKSRSRCFGMLAALQSRQLPEIEEIVSTLSFLADLSAITIERNISEQFVDRLLVIEEQKRIANEIHDSISQNLFSIVYGLDVFVKRVDYLAEEHRQILCTIRDAASQTARELRALIYRLSPRHRGDSTFVQEVSNYLNGLATMNEVSIDFNVSGTEEFLNPAMRRAFYRIIKEATGNAIRHGKCSAINVDLVMEPCGTKLRIADNGRGFDPSLYQNAEWIGKLGLVNMRELISSLQGTLNIESKRGEGTVISCTVPTSSPGLPEGSPEHMRREEALIR